MKIIKGFSPANLSVSLLMAVSLLLTIVANPLTAGAAPSASVANNPWPNSMASTGDSITRAFNTNSFFPFVDATANSWATGTNSTVKSHYSRILANNSLIGGKNYNDAKTGAKMADLKGQMATVFAQKVDYVTVLMGANDVCTGSEATMTDVALFGSQFQAAMDTVTVNKTSTVRVFVSSIPNIYNLWSILHSNSSARTTWSVYGICQSMLANPLSTAQADVDRRNRVSQRNIDFNNQLATICAAYPQCRFDKNAAFNTIFVPADVSTRDYFHPSVTGQAKIAGTTWSVTYPFGT